MPERPAASPPQRAAAAWAAVAANPVWYHTIDLAPRVATPGMIDLRDTAARVLPERLDGRRCLDVGTFDGFWAFELERRGGTVTALDLPGVDAATWPPLHRDRLLREARERELELGVGFRLAHEVLGSGVARVERDVLALEPEDVGGPFDLVFVGAVLLHLRDPVGALERLLRVLRPGGELLLLEQWSRSASWRSPRRPAARFQTLETPFNWWVPNLAALRAWVLTAGFEGVALGPRIVPPSRPEMPARFVRLRARRPA